MNLKSQGACEGRNEGDVIEERWRKWREESSENSRTSEFEKCDSSNNIVSLHYATVIDKLTPVQDLNDQVLSSTMLTKFRLSHTIDVTREDSLAMRSDDRAPFLEY